MTKRFDEVITTRERLREIMGEPNHRVASKVIDHIDAVCKRFIAASPFVVIATKGGDVNPPCQTRVNRGRPDRACGTG